MIVRKKTMAFLLSDYKKLLEFLKQKGYSFGPVKTYYEGVIPPFIFLRHDVDRFSSRAVKMAQAEHNLNVSSTYYFRCDRKGVFPCKAIKKIAALGHEVGFHYETVARTKGDLSAAVKFFERELGSLRKIVDVKTVTAHGSPLSRHSNIGYGEELGTKRFGLLGEPMADMDFSRVFYITDTGGVFGSPNNLRDWSDGRNLRVATAPSELSKILIPQKEPMILLNSHPERWPSSMVGLLQAVGIDMGVILLKKIVRSLSR